MPRQLIRRELRPPLEPADRLDDPDVRRAEHAARVRLLDAAPAGREIGAGGPPSRPITTTTTSICCPFGHARGLAVRQERRVRVDVGDPVVHLRVVVGQARRGRQDLRGRGVC